MTDMLQKTENVAKNVANKNSQDLTEQWKKGELLEKVKQLEELLKDCRLAIFDYPPYDLASDKIRLMNKIDEVLK